MVLLPFANSKYFGVTATGGVYYREATNRILTARRGRLFQKRRLFGSGRLLLHFSIYLQNKSDCYQKPIWVSAATYTFVWILTPSDTYR